MDLRKLLKPNVTEENAIDLIRSMYGLEVIQIRRMSSFNDQNFFIKVSKVHQNPFIDQASENSYTLKIINTLKSSLDGHFESLHSAMRHLINRGLCVPVPVMDLEGKTFNLKLLPLLNKEKELPENEKCGIHLLTYLPGVTIAEISLTKNVLYEWGLLLAKFHQEMQDYDCPILKRKKIFYSLENVSAVKGFTEGLVEEKLNLVQRVLDKYSRKIAVNYESISKGFLHGDFHNHNILVQKHTSNEETVYHVDGILDFEDSYHGPYIWDVGLMMAHAFLEPNGIPPIHAAGYTLAGYLSLRTLTDLEMSLLKICMECRLCMAAVYCHHGIQSDPNNAYISNFSPDTRWDCLRELLNSRNEDLLKQWTMISKEYSPK
ncbi:hypothetical protein JTE90_005529 [Oedothorax gibbosus]|uniref:Hydroxylysine kinase n=1 Tax=Oedothorax gibbosus TaxID=931172 RepID=A0AAV6VAT1_9ARAC|nr:hypothetical protein JTE90_005529 [Oedothorax gibbosus]